MRLCPGTRNLILRSPRLRASRRMSGTSRAAWFRTLEDALLTMRVWQWRGAAAIARSAGPSYAAPQPKQKRPEQMPAPLDPVIAQIIPLLPLRDPKTMTPQSAREALRALAASRAAVPPPPVASAEETKVKGASGFLGGRVYRVSSDKSPTVVFFHGGGWVAGDLDTHDRQARLLAIETGAVVVSVDYRRPPETRFPGAFEDGFAAVRDVFARIAEFGGDKLRLGVAGDRAGGDQAPGPSRD